jgi:hypothetical protein
MKIKRENQRDEDASSVISKPSKPTTISGGIVSFFQTKLNNEVPSKRPKHNNINIAERIEEGVVFVSQRVKKQKASTNTKKIWENVTPNFS